MSPVATASCKMVESRARRSLVANTPDSVTTWRTASKIRSGLSLARRRARHKVSTVGWNPPCVNDRPAAAFQAISRRSRCIASRSERHSNAWRTITAPITGPGIDGRPRGPNRSENISSGNRRRRFSAKNRYTDPTGTRCHRSAVSRNSRSKLSYPCITLTIPPTNTKREPITPTRRLNQHPPRPPRRPNQTALPNRTQRNRRRPPPRPHRPPPQSRAPTPTSLIGGDTRPSPALNRQPGSIPHHTTRPHMKPRKPPQGSASAAQAAIAHLWVHLRVPEILRQYLR